MGHTDRDCPRIFSPNTGAYVRCINKMESENRFFKYARKFLNSVFCRNQDIITIRAEVVFDIENHPSRGCLDSSLNLKLSEI